MEMALFFPSQLCDLALLTRRLLRSFANLLEPGRMSRRSETYAYLGASLWPVARTKALLSCTIQAREMASIAGHLLYGPTIWCRGPVPGPTHAKMHLLPPSACSLVKDEWAERKQLDFS